MSRHGMAWHGIALARGPVCLGMAWHSTRFIEFMAASIIAVSMPLGFLYVTTFIVPRINRVYITIITN